MSAINFQGYCSIPCNYTAKLGCYYWPFLAFIMLSPNSCDGWSIISDSAKVGLIDEQERAEGITGPWGLHFCVQQGHCFSWKIFWCGRYARFHDILTSKYFLGENKLIFTWLRLIKLCHFKLRQRKDDLVNNNCH